MVKNTSGRLCAYCGRTGSLTREHVHSAFLLRDYVPDRGHIYNSRVDRFHRDEGVVRDVCTECNSGPLSALDEYGKEFALKNRLERHFSERRQVLVRYEFELLLRWLLKTSYNSMRYGGQDVASIRPWIPYVLAGGQRPCPVALHVEVIQDHRVDRAELHAFSEELQRDLRQFGGIPALQLRSGPLFGLTKDNQQEAGARHVGINAFRFYILWVTLGDEESPTLRTMVHALRRGAPQAYRLSSSAVTRRVRVSKRDMVDVNKHQVVRERGAWLRHIEEQRRE